MFVVPSGHQPWEELNLQPLDSTSGSLLSCVPFASALSLEGKPAFRAPFWWLACSKWPIGFIFFRALSVDGRSSWRIFRNGKGECVKKSLAILSPEYQEIKFTARGL